jgi:hypothetical protein
VLLDNQSGRLLRGESLDARELLMASDALAKILPPLREPPLPANREDPRAYMWRTYSEMRRRGEIGNAVVEAREVDRLRARVAELEGELHPPTESTPPAAPPALSGNVVPLKPAAAAPAAPPPAAAAPAAPQNWDSTPGGRAWHAWVDAGGPGYDPWADNR